MSVARSRFAAVLTALVVLALPACGGGSHRRKVAAVTTTTAPPPTSSSSSSSTGAPTTAAPQPAAGVPVLAWKDCGGGFQCTGVQAPLDYDHPDGRTAHVSVTRLPASGPADQRIGSLFVNPGGPGASGVDFAHSMQRALSSDVLARFDIVGFDPRATGNSDPVTCESGPELDKYFALDPTPDTQAEHDALVAASKQFAVECGQRGGPALGHIDTRTAARDMDFIRSGLGEDRITYMGFSYGTFLGAMYADLFPNHVRAFILDGAIDPSLSVEEVNRQQAAGFEHSLNAFFADCAAKTSCPFRNNGDPRTAFQQIQAKVEQQPLTTNSGRSVGPGEFLLGVIRPLYRQDDWPSLARALAQAQSGRGDILLLLSDDYTERQSNGTYGNLLSANTAVNCIDRPWSRNPADYDAMAQKFAAESPVFGASLAYGGLVCAFWPNPPVDTARPLRAAGAPPILVVGTTGDPATPYQWAQALTSQLESGVLLTNQGEGHTAFGSANSCIRTNENRYLLEVKPPPKGTTC
jgi:pimeloyl-ACP methyl ester carboxylesterase